MRWPPHQLLLHAAARLNAHGHTALAQDLRQLSRQWTPEKEKELVGGSVDAAPCELGVGRTRTPDDYTTTHP